MKSSEWKDHMSSEWKDQMQVVANSFRETVLDHSKAPYNGIGKILVKFYNPTTKSYIEVIGTAGIIGQIYIITSAHIIRNSTLCRSVSSSTHTRAWVQMDTLESMY